MNSSQSNVTVVPIGTVGNVGAVVGVGVGPVGLRVGIGEGAVHDIGFLLQLDRLHMYNSLKKPSSFLTKYSTFVACL